MAGSPTEGSSNILSVVIPCGPGDTQFLDEAIASSLALTIPAGRKLEIIVMNDTGEGLRIENSQDPVLKVDQTIGGPQGVSVARNLGIEQSRGEFVILLDADDLLLPEFYNITRAAMTKKMAMVMPTGRCFGKASMLGARTRSGWTPRDTQQLSARLRRHVGPFSCGLLRRSAWQALKDRNGHGYDPGLSLLGYEHRLFLLELIALGWHVVELGEPVVWERQVGEGNRLGDRAKAKRYEIGQYIQEKMRREYGVNVAIGDH